MARLTFPPLRSPTPKPIIYPWKQPFAIDPSCVLCLLPIRDNKWYDFSGHGNHGVIEGATWTAKGRHGPALYFDGENDYVNCGTGASLYSSEGTMSVWFKPAVLENRIIVAYITIGQTTDYNTLYIRQVTDGSINVSLRLLSEAWPYHWTFTSATNLLSIGTWANIALTQDGTAPKLYLNRTLIGTASSGSDLTVWSSAIATPFLIGHRTYYGWGKGLIDDVLIYNRALSALEIKALYEHWSA